MEGSDRADWAENMHAGVPGGRLVRFDVLRIVCAAGVAFYHFECTAADALPPVSLRGSTFSVLGSDLNLGTISVQIFFVLSGLFAARTVRDGSFSPFAYYRRRLPRLYVPFWISWLLVCLWLAYWTGGQFFSASASLFPLTLLGLDGFLSASVPSPHPAASDMFYLVGEWFFGALVIITLLWPMMRAAIARFGRLVPVAIAAVEALTFVLPELPVCFFLSYLPLRGMLSYSLGACLGAGGAGARRSWQLSVGAAALVALGLTSEALAPETLRYFGYHLVAFGVVLLVDRFPYAEGLSEMAFKLRGRLGGLIVSLSGLTMYYFLFQHFVVNSFIASSAAAAAEQAFGNFDYLGLAVLSLVATLIVSIVADSLEKRLRAMARPLGDS